MLYGVPETINHFKCTGRRAQLLEPSQMPSLVFCLQQGRSIPPFMLETLGPANREAAWTALGFAGCGFLQVEADRLVLVVREDVALSKRPTGFCSGPWMALVCLAISYVL